MRRLKAEHLADIALFPEVDTMLRALADAGLRLALVSSDIEMPMRAGSSGRPPHCSPILIAAPRCSASPRNSAISSTRRRSAPRHAISIGDEIRDIEAARAAGIACAAVTWGYAAPEALRALGPDLVFDRIEDIARHLTVAS